MIFKPVVATLVLLTAATSSFAKPLQDEPMKPSLVFALKFMFGLLKDSVPEEPTDMLLIGAGYGRTGTSSFVTALNRLGLKSYQMPSVMKTQGHLDLWLDHIQSLKEGKGGIADTIIDSMKVNGFNATSSMPACFIYKELMDRYPKARVILTVRGDGDGHAWAKSVLGSVALMQKSNKKRPFKWIPFIQKFDILFRWVFGQNGAKVRDGTLDENELAAAYNKWVAEVQATVPEERLLVFAAQDGWGPLCDFLSPLSSEIEADCQEIIASGEAYPRVNEREQMARISKAFIAIAFLFEYGVYAIALVAVLWLAKMSWKGKTKRE